MGPSPSSMTLAVRRAEGLVARRTTVGTALAIVLARPDLWLVGALSAGARGGLLLLAVPILTLPTAVGISVILGPDIVSASSPTLARLLIGGIVVSLALVIAGLVVAAIADLMGYERFVNDPESSELRDRREPRRLSGRRRLSTVVSLVAIQATVLVPAFVMAAILGQRASVLIREELINPSSQVPILARVMYGAREPIVALIVVLLLAEVVGSLASRHLLATRFGLGPERRQVTEARSLRIAMVRALAGPVLVASRSAGAWLIAGLLVVPVAGALVIAWEEIRRVYLVPVTLEAVTADARMVVTIGFVALWVLVILMAGLASAIRGALWTAASFR